MAFSKAATFQGYFLPTVQCPQVTTFLAAALGPLVCSSLNGPNLIFGKLPLGKLHNWEIETWEIVSWEVTLGKILIIFLNMYVKFLKLLWSHFKALTHFKCLKLI